MTRSFGGEEIGEVGISALGITACVKAVRGSVTMFTSLVLCEEHIGWLARMAFSVALSVVSAVSLVSPSPKTKFAVGWDRVDYVGVGWEMILVHKSVRSWTY